MDEKSYLRKIKHGDSQALNGFIEELYPPIYRYVYCKVQGKEEAKDITQETFLNFIKQIPNYRSDGKLMAYLYTIASHCCAAYYKKEKRFTYTELQEELFYEDTSLNEDMLKGLQFEELKKLLLVLPLKEQDILIFHYLKQMTFKEIADITKERESTIKSRHYRALGKIKKLLEEGEKHETVTR